MVSDIEKAKRALIAVIRSLSLKTVCKKVVEKQGAHSGK